MAQEVILAEQTLEFSEGWFSTNEQLFSLVTGETYIVAWDGTEYTVIAQDFSEDGGVTTTQILGNLAVVDGGDDTGEPFICFYADGESCIATSDTTATTHTVAVYRVVEDESTEDDTDTEDTTEGASIVLKDRNGEDVTYTGIKTVTFDTPTEGEQVTFTLGVEQTGKEVELALADGDQTVKADDGKLLKELTIKKPETLLPENIRSGMTVAGVVGEFIGDTEEATVALSMADGDQVIEPSAEGKVLSKVTITKPETLVPENIAAGVDIAGIIGTFAGGGGEVNSLAKVITFSSVPTGIVEIFSADELATIGFAPTDVSKACMVCLVGLGVSTSTYIANRLALNILSNQVINYYQSGSIVKLYGEYRSIASSLATNITTRLLYNGATATNTMYRQDDTIVYDADSSTYVLYDKYLAVAVCTAMS